MIINRVKRLLVVIMLVFVGCREDLIHLSSELEANKVLYALRDSGLEATKKSIGKEWVVRISSSELTNALKVLEEKKVFQDSLVGESKEGGAMFQSREEKRSVRDKDLSRTLSGTIRLIPLVKDARVHIYNTLPDPLSLNVTEERSASVLVVHEEGNVSEDIIKELVSKGAGLMKERVSVLFVVAKGGELASKSLVVVDDAIDEASTKVFKGSPIKINYDWLIGGVTATVVSGLMFYLNRRKFKRKPISREDILGKLNEEVQKHAIN